VVERDTKRKDRMYKVELTIVRPNGNTEISDITARFDAMTQPIFNKIKDATEKAGKGNVIEARWYHDVTNYAELAKKYNNLQNEGAEGFVPDPDYFAKTGQLVTTQKIDTYR
jgi:hypothetical protein